MKKTLIFFICAALALPAAAQSWDQALLFSENIYGGTARSTAMGNALTAVGGDPGSIGINPAGGAVAGYSQFFISPGLSITSTVAQGQGTDGLDPIGFGDRVTTGYTRAKLPNMGFMMNMETGRRHGLKRVSIGFMTNSTNDFTSKMQAAGTLYGPNSYSGSLASLAQGYSPDVMGGNWYAEGHGFQPDWSAMAAYRSGMINTIGSDYIGITDIMVGGKPEAVKPLYQRYGNQTKGFKHDVVLNVSANFDDKFYIGANLGVTALEYSNAEYWEEMPNDPSDFPPIKYIDGNNVETQATFVSLLMKRNYRVSGTGLYMKVGALWRPVAGLRLGAAVQTPTVMNMKARLAWSGETDLRGKSYSPSTSPEDEWIYAFNLPFRFNVGAAYTFGSFAVLSVDYEMADYSHARYRGRSDIGYTDGPWTDQNADIKDALGVAHYLRAGLEFKPVPALAIRVGYNFLTGAQKNWLTWEYDEHGAATLYLDPLTKEERKQQNRHLVSFGAGYAIGSFYADVAVRMRFLPVTYYAPYYHYTYGDDYVEKFVDSSAQVPVVASTVTGIDTVLTLGWRF